MKKFFMSVSLTYLLILISCQEPQVDLSLTPTVDDSVIALIEGAGYNPEGVLKSDLGYIVEGDIVLTDDHLDDIRTFLDTVALTRQTWYPSTGILTGNNRTVRVQMSTAFTQNDWGDLLKEAVAMWNAVENCSLKFEIYTSGGQLAIQPMGVSANNERDLCMAYPPRSGQISGPILINTNYINYKYYTTRDRKMMLVHLLGHAVGLGHTYSAVYPEIFANINPDIAGEEERIASTPEADEGSVMIRNGFLSPYINRLTENDIKAIQIMYGDKNAVTVGIRVNDTPTEDMKRITLTNLPDGITDYKWTVTGDATIYSGANSLEPTVRFTKKGGPTALPSRLHINIFLPTRKPSR